MLFFFNDMGIIKWYQLLQEKEQIQIDINHLINKEKKMTQELYRLENDEDYIKKIAKEKFHMVKPGEKIFRIINKRKVNINQNIK